MSDDLMWFQLGRDSSVIVAALSLALVASLLSAAHRALMSVVATLAPGAAWCLAVLVCRLCHSSIFCDTDGFAALCALWLMLVAPPAAFCAIVLGKALRDDGAAIVLVFTLSSWTCMSWFVLASLASI